jgi:hypothetical protein
MSAATKQPAADVVPAGLTRISEMPGAQLPVEECRWTPDQAPLNLHFLTLLGEATGRLEVSGWGGYRQRGAGPFRTLADVDAAALEGVVRRIRRRSAEWVFDVGSAETILDRIDCHFATAQLRRRRGA